MPYKQIEYKQIVFDPKVQDFCCNSNFICPNYKHSHACPPIAPYLEKEISQFKRFYLIYYQLNLVLYIKKEKSKNPNRNKNEILNSIYTDNSIRVFLENEILNFIEKYKDNYEKRYILWDGFCRLCYIKDKKKCTYDEGLSCRYPAEIRYSMEAVGINVHETAKNLDLKLEWPPKHYIYRFGLICYK